MISPICNLTDIDWQAGELRVRQRKTGQPLLLPLTAPVAAALVAYPSQGSATMCMP